MFSPDRGTKTNAVDNDQPHLFFCPKWGIERRVKKTAYGLAVFSGRRDSESSVMPYAKDVIPKLLVRSA